uniref:VP6 n=1 Tax=Ninarumi virus TaxID=2108521 RepID=A0A2P1K565_9REOV|nr:VP6 [Ninarumi virus]
MTQLVLLAPGDIIHAAHAELSQRRVKVDYDEQVAESGELDQAKAGNEDQEVHGGKSTGTSERQGEAATAGSDLAEGARPAHAEVGVAVPTASVANAIKEKFGIDVKIMEDGGVERVLVMKPSLLYDVGLDKDQAKEVGDRVRMWIKKPKTSKDRKQGEVVQVSSMAVLKELLQVKDEGQVNIMAQTRVRLVTNKKKYLDAAQVMFTAPTGDVGWKELAREAAKKQNIQVYVYKQGKDDSETPARSYPALVDHL